jgi:hypothetical protein
MHERFFVGMVWFIFEIIRLSSINKFIYQIFELQNSSFDEHVP